MCLQCALDGQDGIMRYAATEGCVFKQSDEGEVKSRAEEHAGSGRLHEVPCRTCEAFAVAEVFEEAVAC